MKDRIPSRSLDRQFTSAGRGQERKYLTDFQTTAGILPKPRLQPRERSGRMPMQEHVILVNEQGEIIGTEEKMKVHSTGKLHRAFSVFVFNSHDEILLQKRAATKYHSGGLWSNTCCSHPRFGETIEEAAHRRLKEEMGFDCDLEEIFSFIYRLELDNKLIENEFDHVLIGKFDGSPKPNVEEVEAWKWMRCKKLIDNIKKAPTQFTYWFRCSFEEIYTRMGKR